jgi:replicative DNA helicase
LLYWILGRVKEYKIPVLALCQLSRDSGGRPPRLEDLKGSGAIEQDSDVVIGIHSSEDDAGSKELHVLKNRHGEVGMVKVKWQAAATRFEDELLTEMT